MDLREIDKLINDILNGTRDLPQFNQPEHAGVCSAGPLLVGALIVCNLTRESLSASVNASGGETTIPNWQIDEEQERQLQLWAEAKGFRNNGDTSGVNYISDHMHLEDMHPVKVFVEPLAGLPICIDCIVKFRR